MKKGPIAIIMAIVITVAGQACNNARNHSQEKRPAKETVASNDSSYMTYDGDFHEEIIKPEAEAWRKVAALIYPRVCDDSETQWAASYADSLAQAIIERRDLKPAEQKAAICQIQQTIAYGMSYFLSITGVYTNPEAAEAARKIMQDSYQTLNELKGEDFADARNLAEYEQTSYYDFSLFFLLAAGYKDGEPAYVRNNLEMNSWNDIIINSLFAKCRNEVQAYRYSTLINNTTFFMTFCPISYFLAGPEFQTMHSSSINPIALWFDKQAKPVNDAFKTKMMGSLPEYSLKQFSETERQASKYRVQVIHLLAAAIQTLPEM